MMPPLVTPAAQSPIARRYPMQLAVPAGAIQRATAALSGWAVPLAAAAVVVVAAACSR